MSVLLVGFDSAWTPRNSGALVAVLRRDDGTFQELGAPQTADFQDAQATIGNWQTITAATSTLILLDQPTVVPNSTGQRPVENLAGSPVSRRYGGTQPANRSKSLMFGTNAPIWQFLRRCGGATDPREPLTISQVFETYPVLTMIALGWMLTDLRPAGRLPKYNPANKRFSQNDWRYVCGCVSAAFRGIGLLGISDWANQAAETTSVRKTLQDRLDACICLLVAVHLAEGYECLMVGKIDSGYMVVPNGSELVSELYGRCLQSGRDPSEWIQVFRLANG